MISYHPKQWLNAIIRFNRTDTIRRLFPVILGVGAYAFAVAYLEMEVWKLSADSLVKNVSIMHTLLGFVISFTLVFRTNTAYERWWEGRKLWGALVNNSRNLAMKIAAILPPEHPDRLFFRRIIPTYATVLKNHLRSEETRIELFDNLPQATLEMLDLKKHVPNQVASAMIRHIHDLYRRGELSGEQMLYLNGEITSFTDICGACERIKNTPIPYSYGVFIKKFLFFYILTLPFGVPIVAFIFYVLASLELIAEEIEEPFGSDENDLPLSRLAQNIRNHVEELI
jgi:ion channel-forming bestrophin family protein